MFRQLSPQDREAATGLSRSSLPDQLANDALFEPITPPELSLAETITPANYSERLLLPPLPPGEGRVRENREGEAPPSSAEPCLPGRANSAEPFFRPGFGSARAPRPPDPTFT